MNVWTITGNLGRDCEVKALQATGTTVCNFSVAVRAGYGEREQTVWVDCALFGKRAESGVTQYLLKGQQVAVSGELSTFEADSGKTYLKLKVNELDLIGKKDQGGSAPAPQGGQSSGGGYAGTARDPAPPPTGQQGGFNDEFDDDIPFN